MGFDPSSSHASGGLALARNTYQADFTFAQDVAAGAAANLTLAFDAGDASLVNLTAPSAPLIITAGVYALTLSLINTPSSSSAWRAGLLIDDNYYSITPQISTVPSGDGFSQTCCAVTWWCNANDPFAVKAQVAGGTGSDHFAGLVYVQRIA